MNTKFNAILLSLALSGVFTQSVMAADATINVTGNIVASPCEIETTSKTVTIDLGEIQASLLAGANSATDWSPLSTIKLVRCPSTTTSIVATFTGTPDTNDAGTYKNTGTGSTEASIHLVDNTNVTLRNGAVKTLAVASGEASMSVKARLMSSRGGVRPGIVSSAISVAFAYK